MESVLASAASGRGYRPPWLGISAIMKQFARSPITAGVSALNRKSPPMPACRLRPQMRPAKWSGKNSDCGVANEAAECLDLPSAIPASPGSVRPLEPQADSHDRTVVRPATTFVLYRPQNPARYTLPPGGLGTLQLHFAVRSTGSH